MVRRQTFREHGLEGFQMGVVSPETSLQWRGSPEESGGMDFVVVLV